LQPHHHSYSRRPGRRRARARILAAWLLVAPAGTLWAEPWTLPEPPPRGAPLGATSVAHDFIPISGGLGLADIAVTVPAGSLARAEAVVTPTLTVPLVRMPRQDVGADDHPARDRWLARVFLPPALPGADASITYTIRVTPAGGSSGDARPFVLGPFTHSTAPAPALRTPDWAKGAVWYQILPERFRNANPANDPARVLGQELYNPGWTSDWHAVTPDELEHHRAFVWGRWPREGADPARRGGQFYNVVLNRRYGGDLEGVVEKLDELADLGVTAIYFNPIFSARSLHKYDASDHRHVDPTLAGTPPVPGGTGLPPVHRPEAGATPDETEDPATWSWSAADRFLVDVLLPQAHRRNIRVILDGVWNHVGLDHWAFRDLIEHGRASKYADWFDARFVPDPHDDPAGLDEYRRAYPQLEIRPGALIAWNAWNRRNGTLPIFSRSRDGHFHPGVEAYIFGVTRRWMDPDGDGDPSDGIDGWRLDVVPDVPMPFWERWRTLVKSINPDAALICEVWFDAKDYFDGRAFDAQMNYPFAVPAVDWLGLRPHTPANSSDRLARRLAGAFNHRPQVDLAQMNLLGSHDTDRVASMLYNSGEGRDYDQHASPTSDPAYRTGRPPDRIYDLVALGAALQATYPGAPSIYYGDEYGTHGGDDPDCRKPLAWPDLGPMANPDDNPVPGLRGRFRAWLRLRRDPELGPLLRYGLVRHVETANPDAFAFERRLNDSAVIIVLNRADEPFRADLPPADRSDADPADPVVPPRSGRWWRLR
jgi:cyclomaltodextrinase